jgi:two-component system, LytTR family, sensor kinase
MSSSGLLSLSRWQRFLLIMGLWTVLGLIDAGQFYVHLNYFRGRSIHWEEALASGLADWYVWAILAPFIFRLGRRFPLEQSNWPRRLLLHLCFGTGFMLLKVAIDLPLAWVIHAHDALLGPDITGNDLGDLLKFFVASYKFYVTVKFYIYLIIYAAIVGVAHFTLYYRKYREREILAAQLGERLAEARLQVLRMQLHPHFLFNTLNAIAALMHKDVRLADRMIARLGELLRAALEDPGTQEVTLERELAFLTPYLEIEQTRLGPRLAVDLDIPPELLEAQLPYLLLQPLVENAIRHGIGPRPGPGRLEVRARRAGARLVLEVIDDGRGPPAGGIVERIGLSNTRARLRGLYGAAGGLALRPGAQGGLTATVTLPYRAEGEPPPPAPPSADEGVDGAAQAHRPLVRERVRG